MNLLLTLSDDEVLALAKHLETVQGIVHNPPLLTATLEIQACADQVVHASRAARRAPGDDGNAAAYVAAGRLEPTPLEHLEPCS